MSKRADIIEFLKQTKPLSTEGNGPTSIFIEGTIGKHYKKLNISNLTVDIDCITVTIGKYLFKRKYHINKDEI